MKAVLISILAIMWIHFSVSQAATAEKTIVYIKCDLDGKTFSGTGVVVSPTGKVLTARHVAPNGSTCRGSIGVADPNVAAKMVQQPVTIHVDAALLRFADQKTYEFMPYCMLEDWMIRRKILVAGFPGTTKTGVPSFREGVLSTVLPNPDGIIETDGQTVGGMSGGPVFSKNLAGLVGIVLGADFAKDGTVSYYGILPFSPPTAAALELVPSKVPCYRRSREVELPISVTGWNADKHFVPLGVRKEEGVCFLSKVWGQFDSPEDSVSVELQNDEYFLTGVSKSIGQRGASARCIWYDDATGG
jgi:hypothetical protein